jgi:hypothetical protein
MPPPFPVFFFGPQVFLAGMPIGCASYFVMVYAIVYAIASLPAFYQNDTNNNKDPKVYDYISNPKYQY